MSRTRDRRTADGRTTSPRSRAMPPRRMGLPAFSTGVSYPDSLLLRVRIWLDPLKRGPTLFMGHRRCPVTRFRTAARPARKWVVHIPHDMKWASGREGGKESRKIPSPPPPPPLEHQGRIDDRRPPSFFLPPSISPSVGDCGMDLISIFTCDHYLPSPDSNNLHLHPLVYMYRRDEEKQPGRRGRVKIVQRCLSHVQV